MRVNRTKTINRIVAMLLALFMVVITSFPMMASQAVKKSNYVISKLDKARTDLEIFARERSISAAIYLKDAYAVKLEPDQYSEDVILLASGQTVLINSVDVDEGRNIWYRVEYTYANTTITGYVEREFLACSDARFLSWEDKYITTTNREKIRDLSDCSDIEAFPESYRDALYALRKSHPTWRFVRQEVGLDWNKVILEEASGERSLISSSADSSYKECPSAGTSGWYVATKGIISYYVDPRNFLDSDTIFMFELETFNSNTHTSGTVAKVLNGTFMSGGIPGTNASYADTFVAIGSKYNMSPIALASRVKQEQGVSGTSPLISGTYPGFEGYYNYFNVKANGSTNEAIYKNGLTHAKSQGWNTRIKSLEGGAKLVAGNYVNRGQDTLYLQKFDVDASDNTLFTHQYMQNIVAPYSEARSTYKAYSDMGLLDTPFVFKIPVYTNMPKGKCIRPNAKDVVSLNVDLVENLPVDQNAVLISLINGAQNNDVPISYDSSDEKIAKVDSNGVITGMKPGVATISATRAENPTNTVKCQVSVIKADIALSKVVMPELEEVYSKEMTLASIALPDGFAWVDASIIPTVDNDGYSVIYSPDDSRYNSLTLTMPVLVKKANIDPASVTVPQMLTMGAGEQLSSVKLPVGFAWVDSSVVAPKKTGVVAFDAVYCEDPACYEPLDVKISVKVVCTKHEYGEWEGVHADCEHDAILTRKCNICGDKETVTEVATGHIYQSSITKEATTKEAGIRTYICENCDDTYTEEIPKLTDAHVHTYSQSISIKPTCLAYGEMTYTCACGDSYTEPIEASGHVYDDNYVCKECGYELAVVPIHIHDYSLFSSSATCTEEGENVYMCGCGDSYTEDAPALNHDMKNGRCTICGYIESLPTPSVSPQVTPDEIVTPTPATKPSVEPTVRVTPSVAPTHRPTPTAELTPSVAPTQGPTPTVGPTSTVAPTLKPTKSAEPSKDAKPTKALEPTHEKTAEPTSGVTITKTPEPTKDVTPTKAADTHGESTQLKKDKSKNDKPVVIEAPIPTGVDKPISIVMMSSTILDKDKIDEYISSDNKKLEINLENDVRWNVDLSDIEDYSDFNLDLQVKLKDAPIPAEVIDTLNDLGQYDLIELAYDGEFPCSVVLSIPTGMQQVGRYANLYYYNPDTGMMEYIITCVVDKDGYASYRMKHASSYAIVYSDEVMDADSLLPDDTDEIQVADIAVQQMEETEGKEKQALINPNSQFIDHDKKIIVYGAIVIVAIILIGVIIGLILRSRHDEDE